MGKPTVENKSSVRLPWLVQTLFVFTAEEMLFEVRALETGQVIALGAGLILPNDPKAKTLGYFRVARHADIVEDLS